MEIIDISKKGVTNIEMIIATTIFIFSVVIVIYYISFIGVREEPSDIFLDTLEKKLRDENEINYTTIYLAISQTNAQCFNISRHADMHSNENFSFIKENDLAVDFNISEDYNWLLINNTGIQNHNFTIYSFPFNITNPNRLENVNCISLVMGQDYNYSIPYQNKIFIYENITSLKKYSYDELKQQWNFQKDFLINVTNTYTNEIIFNVSGIKALEVQVKARQFPIKLINKNGAMFDGIINLQVW